ncbi:MAG: branched-chain amino acid ABC transporter permease [Deltaproteobacteria bacterium]|nr:branched-chain amino acid ABC transporter permease [Deltaproteobacteria bacterium]
MGTQNTTMKKTVINALILFILLLLAATPLFAPVYTIILLTSILMYMIIAVSWALFSGPTGYISLASAAFFGVGIYTSAVLGMALPLPLVIALGALFSAGLALLVGMLTLRLRGIYFVMFTFGLVELLLNFILWWEVNITGTTGRVVPPMANTTVFYTMLTILVALILTVFFIRRSRYGLALESIGENEEATAHAGVNVTALKVIVYAVSALFMGAAGATMATRWTYIDPKIAFNPLISFMPVLMAIFGGIRPLYGPIIGAAIFTYLEEFLLTRFPYHYMLIFGIIMVVAILYMPEGLVGLTQRIWKRLSRRTHAHT